MAVFDYISQIEAQNPKCHEDGSLPSPLEIENYFTYLEQMRQEFLSFLVDKNPSVIRAYLDELILVKKQIEKRGLVLLTTKEAAELVTSEVEGADIMSVAKDIDMRLYSSVENAIAFVKSLLGEDDAQPVFSDKPVEAAESVVDTGWYTVDEVCKKYKLSKNKVKNRQWRIKVGFPTHQDGGAYSSVRFCASEVEDWMAKNK